MPPLEQVLIERIAGIRARDSWAPILVVAPTGRILTSLRRLILGRGRTIWAVHLLHHRALAERIVESAGARPLRVLRGRQQKDLVAGLLSGIRDRNPLERSASESGGALSALLASLRDLREALVPPGALDGEAGPLPLARVYRAWSSELERLEGAGLGDAVSLARQAGRLAAGAPIIERAAAVLHFGAYDLTGANRDRDVVHNHATAIGAFQIFSDQCFVERSR
ncbi:MAG: hypothetical protein HOP19_29455 [Acidobacteria bacterium]|nr:hypothetical protein [Acidobacteriota bacterium]